jgi:nucleoside-diphosphate kinase
LYEPQITRTLVVLKPDAIRRGLVGEIFRRFENKGLKIVTSDLRLISDELAKQHYVEHAYDGEFYQKMCDALTAGPVMPAILEGISAVDSSRQLIGQASPLHHSPIGTIRADFAIHEPFNLVHGSDSPAAAKREITLWYGAKWCKVDNPNPHKAKPTATTDEVAIPAGELIKMLQPPKKGMTKELMVEKIVDTMAGDASSYIKNTPEGFNDWMIKWIGSPAAIGAAVGNPNANV